MEKVVRAISVKYTVFFRAIAALFIGNATVVYAGGSSSGGDGEDACVSEGAEVEQESISHKFKFQDPDLVPVKNLKYCKDSEDERDSPECTAKRAK
ncbi:MAG: hypothetical protein ACXWQO_16070 [Bdellovibrionota bacterium]